MNPDTGQMIPIRSHEHLKELIEKGTLPENPPIFQAGDFVSFDDKPFKITGVSQGSMRVKAMVPHSVPVGAVANIQGCRFQITESHPKWLRLKPIPFDVEPSTDDGVIYAGRGRVR